MELGIIKTDNNKIRDLDFDGDIFVKADIKDLLEVIDEINKKQKIKIVKLEMEMI